VVSRAESASPAALKRGKLPARPMPPRRLPDEAPASAGKRLAFRWGRRALQGREGDTVASALLAAGEAVLTRSVKYHRPRSYLCGVGKCANCLVTIDGKPSQRACMVPLRSGMVVEAQNAWPSPRYDLFGASDAMLKKGFDPQRTLTKPLFVVPWYHAVVRRMAGLGKLPRGPSAPAQPAALAREAVPLAVVGGGPAGLAAGAAAAEAGADVVVFDEAPWRGGRLAGASEPLRGPEPYVGRAPREVAEHLLDRLAGAGGELRSQANVAGFYGERQLAVQTPQRLVEVAADVVVLATGAPEALPLFEDNDRPGIMSLSGAALLLERHALLAGGNVVLVGATRESVAFARRLQARGARVEAILGAAPAGAPGDLPFLDAEPLRAEGISWVRALEVRMQGGGTRTLPCDLVAFAAPRRPAVELAQQAGCALALTEGALAPQVDAKGATTTRRVFAAGDLVAPGSVERAIASGTLAGLAAAEALGLKVEGKRREAAEAAVRGLSA